MEGQATQAGSADDADDADDELECLLDEARARHAADVYSRKREYAELLKKLRDREKAKASAKASAEEEDSDDDDDDDERDEMRAALRVLRLSIDHDIPHPGNCERCITASIKSLADGAKLVLPLCDECRCSCGGEKWMCGGCDGGGDE